MELTANQMKHFKQHAMESYPRECIGVISNGWYKELENISEDPDAFEVSSQALYAFENVTAVLHTHCVDGGAESTRYNRRTGFDERTPSMADVALQQKLKVPFGIAQCRGDFGVVDNCSDPIWLGDTPEPLIGRKFLYHINDCYTLVREYYRLNYDIELMDHHEEWQWWQKPEGQGAYIEKFEEAGFIETDRRLLEPGDLLLVRFRSDVPNHLAVYTGNGKILHHMWGQLSMEAPFGKWASYTVKTLRYDFD